MFLNSYLKGRNFRGILISRFFFDFFSRFLFSRILKNINHFLYIPRGFLQKFANILFRGFYFRESAQKSRNREIFFSRKFLPIRQPGAHATSLGKYGTQHFRAQLKFDCSLLLSSPFYYTEVKRGRCQKHYKNNLMDATLACSEWH